MSDFHDFENVKKNAISNGNAVRKILVENPDLPVVFMADEESACDERGLWTTCDIVWSDVRDITFCNDKWFDDVDDVREELENYLGMYYDISGDELTAKVEEELGRIEWMRTVVIRVTN